MDMFSVILHLCKLILAEDDGNFFLRSGGGIKFSIIFHHNKFTSTVWCTSFQNICVIADIHTCVHCTGIYTILYINCSVGSAILIKKKITNASKCLKYQCRWVKNWIRDMSDVSTILSISMTHFKYEKRLMSLQIKQACNLVCTKYSKLFVSYI